MPSDRLDLPPGIDLSVATPETIELVKHFRRALRTLRRADKRELAEHAAIVRKLSDALQQRGVAVNNLLHDKDWAS